MPIEVIDKIKQKNGGTFKLMDAKDIAIEDTNIEDYTKKIKEESEKNNKELLKKVDSDCVYNKQEIDTKVWTMDNIGEDVKKAMTGGSVAVVGENAVGTINLKDKSIDEDKCKFSNENIYFSGYVEYEITDWTNKILKVKFINGSCKFKMKKRYGYSNVNLNEEYILNNNTEIRLNKDDGSIRVLNNEEATFENETVLLRNSYLAVSGLLAYNNQSYTYRKTGTYTYSYGVKIINNNIKLDGINLRGNIGLTKTFEELKQLSIPIKTINDEEYFSIEEGKAIIFNNYKNALEYIDLKSNLSRDNIILILNNGMCLEGEVISNFNNYKNVEINKDLEKIKNNWIPKYYEDDKEKVKEKVLDVLKPNSLLLGFITDIQIDGKENNYSNIGEISKILPISFIADGGDFINGDKSKKEILNNLYLAGNRGYNSAKVPYIITKGNHDDNGFYYNTHGKKFEDLINSNEWYNRTLKYLERNPRVIFDTENIQGGYCYIDDIASKVRTIFINVCDIPYIRKEDGSAKYTAMNDYGIREKQLNFIAKAMKLDDKENPNEWGLLFVSHFIDYSVKNMDMVTNMIIKKRSGEKFTQHSDYEDFSADVTMDFTGHKGEVIGFLCGHTHTDGVDTFLGGTLTVITSISSMPDGEDRILGTKTEDSFNIVTINRNEKKIYFTRFGYGDDRVITYV